MNAASNKQKKLNNVDSKPLLKPWKYKTLLSVTDKKAIDVNNGIILGSTKWKACRCVLYDNIQKKITAN